jgi:hypothetical protein
MQDTHSSEEPLRAEVRRQLALLSLFEETARSVNGLFKHSLRYCSCTCQGCLRGPYHCDNASTGCESSKF